MAPKPEFKFSTKLQNAADKEYLASHKEMF